MPSGIRYVFYNSRGCRKSGGDLDLGVALKWTNMENEAVKLVNRPVLDRIGPLQNATLFHQPEGTEPKQLFPGPAPSELLRMTSSFCSSSAVSSLGRCRVWPSRLQL